MQLHFKCPNTRLPIQTETGSDFKTLEKKWFSDVTAYCPHCRARHTFEFRKAYVDSVLNDTDGAYHTAVPHGH
jgi:hypothetical protein